MKQQPKLFSFVIVNRRTTATLQNIVRKVRHGAAAAEDEKDE